jgi:predicted PurR-regulated permease PerM
MYGILGDRSTAAPRRPSGRPEAREIAARWRERPVRWAPERRAVRDTTAPVGNTLATRWVYGVAALLALCALTYLLRGVLTPVFFAFLLAYMLDPVVDRFEAAGVARATGIVAVLVVALGALGLSALLVLPAVIADLAALVAELPRALGRLIELLQPVLAERGVELPSSGAQALSRLQQDLGQWAPSALGSLRSALASVVGGTANVLGAAAGLLMVPVLAFYLLHDFDHGVAAARELLPARRRDAIVDVVGEVDTVLGQFMRGQVTVMAILAVLYAAGYAAVGVPLAVPIGLVAGALAFIPYVGGAVALGLALLMVALHFEGLTQVILVVSVYGLVQVLEGFVITPRIVGDKLGLPPVWVLFALMAGGELFGFLGVMLALPAAAVCKVFVLRGLAHYRQSALYLGREPEPVVAGPLGHPVSPPKPARLRWRPRRATRRKRRR